MREILFRGKTFDNEWVYGYYVNQYKWPEIYCQDTSAGERRAIIPETIGQYTGLTDKNGKKIFEGDICHFYGGEYYSGFWEVNHIREIKICHECLWYLENAEYIEVIGNIFDNTELLGDELK